MLNLNPKPASVPFRFNPIHLKRTYGVMFTIGGGPQEQQVKYEMTVSCMRRLNAQQYLFSLEKGQVYIDDKIPEKLIDKLSESCGKIIYPLQVVIDQQGNFKAIQNAAEIRQRWQEVKPGLQQYYTGEIAESIFKYMDIAVEAPAHIYQSLCQDWFMALYFSGFYQEGSDIMEREADLLLPVIPYTQPVAFHVMQKPGEYHTPSGCMVIQQKGACTDERSMEDLLKGNAVPLSRQLTGMHTPAKGAVQLEWKLYHLDYSINAITGSCTLQLPEDQVKNITIEIYHLKEKDVAAAPVVPVLIEEEPTPAPKRKGLFSFFGR